MLIDTHAHLDFPEFDADRAQVIQQAKAEGIRYIINIGTGLAASQKSIRLSQEYDFIYATVGWHPHDADKYNPDTRAALEELAKNKKVVAIGEIGLDYFKNYSPQDRQRLCFADLLQLARDLRLPAVIHCRQAEKETLEMLKNCLPLKAVVHCFSGDRDFLQECLNLGFWVSFTCNITYVKAFRLRELAKDAPLERMMLETDAPFLPPEGRRGQRNEPRYVQLLAAQIAEIKEINIEEVARKTSENAVSFFNLPR